MNVCRLCLSEGHGHLQPVYYAQDSPDEILLQKILELTTVEVSWWRYERGVLQGFPLVLIVDGHFIGSFLLEVSFK